MFSCGFSKIFFHSLSPFRNGCHCRVPKNKQIDINHKKAARHLQEGYFISGAAKHVGYHHRCWKAMHLGSGERGELCKILPKMSAGWGAGKSGHFTITLLAYEVVLLLFINLINLLLAKWKVNNGSLPTPHPFCCYALPLLDLFRRIINKIHLKKLKSVKQNLKKSKFSPSYNYDCTRVLFVICTCGRTLHLFYMKNALVFSQSEAHNFFQANYYYKNEQRNWEEINTSKRYLLWSSAVMLAICSFIPSTSAWWPSSPDEILSFSWRLY